MLSAFTHPYNSIHHELVCLVDDNESGIRTHSNFSPNDFLCDASAPGETRRPGRYGEKQLDRICYFIISGLLVKSSNTHGNFIPTKKTSGYFGIKRKVRLRLQGLPAESHPD